MPPKPKQNYQNQPEKDMCQTPPYALEPLLPYIDDVQFIWESATGEGLLAETLRRKTNATVISTDILHDNGDFFTEDALAYWYPEDSYQGKRLICTNPPFSLKYKWLERCYELGYPFALLMPSDTLFAASANKLFQKHGIEIIIMNPRVDFKMPNKGWSGNGAQMSTAWFTWGLIHGRGEIGLHFADISAAKKQFKEQLKNGG